MAITLLPSPELVAAAWISTLPGITSGMVATTLPTDTASWQDSGFYTVATVGGVPDLDVPIRRPLIQVDCWAVKVNSQRPPWGKADQLAQRLINACWGDTAGAQQVMVTAGANTATALIRGVWAASEPTRLYGDDSSYARMRVDIRIDYT